MKNAGFCNIYKKYIMKNEKLNKKKLTQILKSDTIIVEQNRINFVV